MQLIILQYSNRKLVKFFGGEVVPIYMRLRAPTIYQANQDELAQVTITAISFKDPELDFSPMTIDLMWEDYIEILRYLFQVDIEQHEASIQV